MSLIRPHEIDTSFTDTQRFIALRYLEHFCNKINSESTIADLVGYRIRNQFERNDGLMFDQYPYDHEGKSIGIGFKLFDETWIELIKENCYFVLHLYCQIGGENTTSFHYEFLEDDKLFGSIITDEILEVLE